MLNQWNRIDAGGTLKIGINMDEGMIEMNIIDYGVGIQEERYQKLGEPFTQTKNKDLV